jgi:hypothetical protein
MTASLAHHMPSPDVAPKTSAAVATKASAAVQWLASQLPPSVNTRSPLTPQIAQPTSKAQSSAWLRKLDVYEDPLSVVHDMAKGHLSTDKADALKAMYPALFADVQKEIIKQVTDGAAKGKEPSFKARMQMGILFGVPTDATMDPSFLQSQQALYANPPPEEDAIQQKAPGALASLNLHESDLEQTQSERLEAGPDR